jgi:hypothetical protein
MTVENKTTFLGLPISRTKPVKTGKEFRFIQQLGYRVFTTVRVASPDAIDVTTEEPFSPFRFGIVDTTLYYRKKTRIVSGDQINDCPPFQGIIPGVRHRLSWKRGK